MTSDNNDWLKAIRDKATSGHAKQETDHAAQVATRQAFAANADAFWSRVAAELGRLVEDWNKDALAHQRVSIEAAGSTGWAVYGEGVGKVTVNFSKGLTDRGVYVHAPTISYEYIHRPAPDASDRFGVVVTNAAEVAIERLTNAEFARKALAQFFSDCARKRA